MFEKIKNWFYNEPKETFSLIDVVEKNKPAENTVKKPRVRKPKQSPIAKELTPKEIATQNGEPYISILKVDLDPNDINNGTFELDWNDKFLVNLIKSGFKVRADDTESQIVDRWFQAVCRNIALEVYEQDQADPTNRDMISDMRVIKSRDLGNGRSEVS